MRSLWLLLPLALAACGTAGTTHSKDPNRGVPAGYVPRDHHHDETCGHYLYLDRWFHVPDHWHRPGCGHHMINKQWVYVEPVSIPADHRHDAYCGHYQHGGQWYRLAKHIHGLQCGHINRNGVWVLD